MICQVESHRIHISPDFHIIHEFSIIYRLPELCARFLRHAYEVEGGGGAGRTW